MWFKGIVAVTCIAILAVIGYWSWQLWQDNRQKEEQAAYLASRQQCVDSLETFANPYFRDVKTVRRVLSGCVADGYLSVADLDEYNLANFSTP